MKSKQALGTPKVIFTSTVNTPKENTQVQQFCRERGSEFLTDPILPWISAVDQLWSYPQGYSFSILKGQRRIGLRRCVIECVLCAFECGAAFTDTGEIKMNSF